MVARRASELVAPEGGFFDVEEVARVERAVPQNRTLAVKLVGADLKTA